MRTNEIYKGDAYKLIKQVPDQSVDLIYTDIPYLLEGGGGGSSPLARRISKENDLLKDNNIVNGIDYNILNEFMRVMKKVNCFIWCSKLQLPTILNFFLSQKGRTINYEFITWNKTNPTPATNNTWLPDQELCLYFREKGCPLNNGYELKHHYFNSPINKFDKDNYNHPTIKPLEFVEKHILHTTKPNDIVLDPFLGSGTTALACQRNNRQYIGFEIDERFFKIATDRLSGFNQKGQGDLFDLQEKTVVHNELKTVNEKKENKDNKDLSL